MKRVEFIILKEDGHKETLKCPECDTIFDIDAISWLNMTWDKETKWQVSVCPGCGVTQQ